MYDQNTLLTYTKTFAGTRTSDTHNEKYYYIQTRNNIDNYKFPVSRNALSKFKLLMCNIIRRADINLTLWHVITRHDAHLITLYRHK